MILDITDLGEEIGRPRLVEQALSTLHDGDVRQNGRHRSARTGLALIGRSWERAYSLLDGTRRGGVRTHLLRLLHGGSLEAALTIDPRPVRCWEPAAETETQAIRHRPSSITLSDLIREYEKSGETKRHVRSATIGDIPHIQTLCRRLCEVPFGNEGYGDHDAQRQRDLEMLLAIPWHTFVEAKVPFLIGLDGSNVVGLVVGREEKTVVLMVERAGVAFAPVLLEGLVKVMLSHGMRPLKVWVRQATQRFFEEAGWHSSGTEADSGQVCMEYAPPVADTP